MSASRCKRRTHRSHQRTRWSKSHGSFHDRLGGFHRNLRNHSRHDRRHRFRLAIFRIGGQGFVVHHGNRGTLPSRRLFYCRFASQASPHQHDLIVLQRAGVRLLVCDAQVRKQLKDRAGLNFQFPSQLVDANFAHTLRLWHGIRSRARSEVFPGPSLSTLSTAASRRLSTFYRNRLLFRVLRRDLIRRFIRSCLSRGRSLFRSFFHDLFGRGIWSDIGRGI